MRNNITKAFEGAGKFFNEFNKYIAPKTPINGNMFGFEPLKSLLPYRTYDKENQIYYNKNSQGFILEVTPLQGADNQTIDILTGIFTGSIPKDCTIQIINYASPKIGHILKYWQEAREGEVYKKLAKSRCNYYKGANWKSLFAGNDYLIRDYRVFICVSLPNKHKNATYQLETLRTQLEKAFQSMNQRSNNTSPNAFLSLIYELIYPDRNLYPKQIKWNEYDMLNNQLNNPECIYKVEPDHIGISNGNEETFARSYTIEDFPDFWSQMQVTDLMGDSIKGVQIPCPFIKVFAFTFGDGAGDNNKASANLLNSERELKTGSKFTVRDTAAKQKDWEFVLNQLKAGQKLTSMYYQVTILSTKEDLERNDQAVDDIYRPKGWNLKTDRFMQMQSWQSILPFNFSEGLSDDLKFSGRLRTHITWTCANIAPLQGEYKGSSSPYLMLMGRRGQPLLFDPFISNGNYNVAIVGASGSGKSVLMQEMLSASRSLGHRVIVIDDGKSFQRASLNQGGDFIYIGGEKNYCINPFSLLSNKEFADNEYKNLVIGFISNIIKHICYGQYGGSQIENAFIKDGILQVWESKGQNASIEDVADYLLNLDDKRAQDRGKILSTFVKLNKDYFIGKADLDTENQYIVFELSNLKDNKELQSIVLMLIMFLVFTRVYMSDRKKRTTLVIDEAWSLLQGEACKDFIEPLVRKGRKYNANLMTGTQSIQDYHANDASKVTLQNSEWVLILAQKSESIDDFKAKNQINMTPHEEKLIRSLRKVDNCYSEVMVKSSEGSFIGRLILDPFSIALYSSNPDDVRAIQDLQNQGLSLQEALEALSQKIGEKNAT